MPRVRGKSNGSGNGEPREASAGTALRLVQLPSAHPCHQCGDCCRYIAVEIDNPSTFGDYDNIFWYLTHRGVSVYVDWEGDWFIEFATVCEHLTEAQTCGIYEERPKMCSDFSWNECERTTGEPAFKHLFVSPAELLEWMKERRPRAHAKYVAAREKLLAKRRASAPTLTPLETELTLPSP